MSHGRLFINTRSPLPVGEAVKVTLSCPSQRLRFTLRGRVQRSFAYGNATNDAPGMLIEVPNLDAAMLQDLDALRRDFRTARTYLTP